MKGGEERQKEGEGEKYEKIHVGRGKTGNACKASRLLKNKSNVAFLQYLGIIFFNHATAYEHHDFHLKIKLGLVKGYIFMPTDKDEYYYHDCIPTQNVNILKMEHIFPNIHILTLCDTQILRPI